MNKVLLVKEGDGIVVKVPCSESDLVALANTVPNCRVVDVDALPKDREFRDAWTLEGKVDLTKAKEIWKSKLRIARDEKLKELDIKWMKAMEKGDIKIAQSIAADKQVLRDLTEREELTKASSVEEIKAFWPQILKG